MTAKLMLFFDYDTQWGADRSRAGRGPLAYGMDEFTGAQRVLELLAKHRIPACFAVVGAAALPGRRPYHDPAQIRAIHAQGHEIASHSMTHDWLPDLGPQCLRQDLRESRDALEQCIGAPVISFVPPFNQPFDCWVKGAISLSERRQVRQAGRRIDLLEMCRALAETGYRFARVSYRSLPDRLAEMLAEQARPAFARPVVIHGVVTLRLNTPGGFSGSVIEWLAKSPNQNGTLVVYGHPHSIYTAGPQAESSLAAFLVLAADLVRRGALEVIRPHQLLARARGALSMHPNATI